MVRDEVTRGRVVLVAEGGIPGGLSTAEADFSPVNVEQRPFEFEDPIKRTLYGC